VQTLYESATLSFVVMFYFHHIQLGVIAMVVAATIAVAVVFLLVIIVVVLVNKLVSKYIRG